MNAQGFVRTFGVTWCIGVVLMLVPAIYVNPWGNFGDVGITRHLRSRPVKIDHLRKLPDDKLPQVVVFGSSNTMPMRSETITAELGKTAFNLGVFWGKSEDYLCLLNWLVKDRGHVPELAIVGIDAWTIAPADDDHPIFPGLTRELLNTPDLIKYHPDVSPIPMWWSRIIDSFSQGIIKEYYRLARGAMAGERVTREHWPSLTGSKLFREDGVRIMYGDAYGRYPGNIFQMVEDGKYPIGEIIQDKLDSGRVEELIHFKTYAFTQFRQQRIDYLDSFLALASERGMRVVFVLNPVHPLFWKVLDDHTQHREHIKQLDTILNGFRKEHSALIGVVDASHIEYFGGDPTGFYDEIHPTIENADLILKKVAEVVRASAAQENGK